MTCQMSSHSQKTALYNNVFHQRCLSQNSPAQTFALGIQPLGTKFIQQNWHTLSKGLRLSQGWGKLTIYREVEVIIFRTHLPGITHHKAKLFGLRTHVLLQIIDYIYYKTHEFHLFGVFLWIFSCSQLLKRNQCSPIREETGSTSYSHTSLRENSLTVAENLKKLLIFEKQMSWSFGKEIKKNKKEIRRKSLSKKSSTRAMPWALLLKNAPPISSGILRQRWWLITIIYIIIYNIKY